MAHGRSARSVLATGPVLPAGVPDGRAASVRESARHTHRPTCI